MLRSLKNWFFSKGDHMTLAVGSRVNTRWGPATIIGGSLNVRLDKPYGRAKYTGMSVNVENVSL